MVVNHLEERMNQIVLLYCLHDDPVNTLKSTVRYIEREKEISLLDRDGVVLLSDNAILLEKTKSHGVLVQLCAILEQKGRPYLLFHMDHQASLVSGKPPKAIESLLSSAGVQFVYRS